MGGFVTAEAARERFRELADQVDAAYAEMRALPSDGVGSEFRVELGERLEIQERTNRAGPTAPNHPTSTTPTTPKNSSTATPTHPRAARTDKDRQVADGVGALMLSGQP